MTLVKTATFRNNTDMRIKDIRLTSNKTVIINIASTVLLQGLSFFTIPIFTRLLGAEQYGQYSVFNSWMLILTCLIGVKIESSLGTGRYEFYDDYNRFKSNALGIGSILGIALIAMMLLFYKQLSVIIQYDLFLYIILLVLSFSHFIIGFAQTSFIYEKKASWNFYMSVTLAVLSIVISLFLISKSGEETRYIGRIIGIFIPYVCMALLYLILVLVRTPISINKEHFKFALVISLPIVFHSLSQQILSQSDRIMLQKLWGNVSDVGIYSVYYSFVNVLMTILLALNNSWCPYYYDDLHNEAYECIRSKSRNYIELFTILCVGFILVAREVSRLLVNEEYWSGISVVPIIVCSVFFTFMYQFQVNYELYNKKTIFVAIGTILAGLMNIALNFWLIPQFGMIGAAVATAIAYFALFGIHYIIVVIMTNNSFHSKFRDFIPSILIIGISVLMYYFLEETWIIRWIMAALIGIFEITRIVKRKTIF